MSEERKTKRSTPVVCKLQVDSAKLAARAIITDGSLDRDCEIVEPSGGELKYYANAGAPVFFNHQQFPFPIGSSKENPNDPDCPLSVDVGPDAIVATCYFNRVTPEAIAILDLVRLGHLKATSIGFKSHEVEVLDAARSEALGSPWPVLVHKKWELVEWSIVGVGSNREAVTIALDNGGIGENRFTPSIVKMLSPLRLQPKGLVRGFAPEEIVVSEKATPPVAKADGDNDDDNGTGKETPALKPGQALVECLLGGLKAALTAAAEILPTVENTVVREATLRSMRAASELADDLAEAAKEEYEDLKYERAEIDFSELGDDEPAEPAEPKGDDEVTEEEAKRLEYIFDRLAA